MMLTMPPKARPCSAPKPLLTTRNSLTASWEGVARWEPVAVLMVSAPSTVTRLLKSRMPPKEMRVTSDSVKVDCRLVRPVVTPGVSRTKSVNNRRSEEHTSELQSRSDLVCRLLLEKKKKKKNDVQKRTADL